VFIKPPPMVSLFRHMKVREIKGSKKLTGHLQNLLIEDKVDRKTGEEYEIKKRTMQKIQTHM
jgi:hypothetical protein